MEGAIDCGKIFVLCGKEDAEGKKDVNKGVKMTHLAVRMACELSTHHKSLLDSL